VKLYLGQMHCGILELLTVCCSSLDGALCAVCAGAVGRRSQDTVAAAECLLVLDGNCQQHRQTRCPASRTHNQRHITGPAIVHYTLHFLADSSFLVYDTLLLGELF